MVIFSAVVTFQCTHYLRVISFTSYCQIYTCSLDFSLELQMCRHHFLVAQWQRICLQCRSYGLDSWVRKIHGEGRSNPLQYSCLENPTDGGAWRATVQAAAKSGTTGQLTLTFFAECNVAAPRFSILYFPFQSGLFFKLNSVGEMKRRTYIPWVVSLWEELCMI